MRGVRPIWIGITQTPVTVILGAFLEHDVLHLATYFAVDVLSLSNKQVAATSV